MYSHDGARSCFAEYVTLNLRARRPLCSNSPIFVRFRGAAMFLQEVPLLPTLTSDVIRTFGIAKATLTTIQVTTNTEDVIPSP